MGFPGFGYSGPGLAATVAQDEAALAGVTVTVAPPKECGGLAVGTRAAGNRAVGARAAGTRTAVGPVVAEAILSPPKRLVDQATFLGPKPFTMPHNSNLLP